MAITYWVVAMAELSERLLIDTANLSRTNFSKVTQFFKNNPNVATEAYTSKYPKSNKYLG